MSTEHARINTHTLHTHMEEHRINTSDKPIKKREGLFYKYTTSISQILHTNIDEVCTVQLTFDP